jgi:DNA-directed RNA polymerase subunit RPC12/RpoP
MHPMSVLQAQRPKKSMYQRGVVICGKCAARIPVQKLTALADEFTVRCPNCGSRDFYTRRAVIIEEMPERRKKPRG